METKNPLMERIKEIFNEINLTTNRLLTESPNISEQYSGLDPMLKHNFDVNLSTVMSTAVIAHLKNLQIYSNFSLGGTLYWIAPENFFNRAEKERNKIEKVLQETIDSSFLADEIREESRDYLETLVDFSTIEHKYRELRESMMKDMKKEWREEENNLINGVLQKRVKIAKGCQLRE